MGNTKKFHINMLKKYEECEPLATIQASTFIVVEEEETDNPLPSFNPGGGQGIEAIQKSKDLSETQKMQVEKMLQGHKDIFSEIPGRTHLLEGRVELTTSDPINTPRYPLLFSVQVIVEKEVNDMLKLGVIERSHSPYHSPLILVKKPDNT